MKIVTLITFGCLSTALLAQDFENGDFDGDAEVNKYSVVPSGWQAVSYNSDICMATSEVCATIDLASLQAPAAKHGNAGKAYSGATFMSGLIAQSGPHIWHEGVKQTVNGLLPGKTYEISFFQAVVQQDNKSSFHCFDKSGSWGVYVNDELVGISEPSKTKSKVHATDLNWEERKITFTASNTSHTFAFMPVDDDTDYEAEKNKEGLRMGIDFVRLSEVIDDIAVNTNEPVDSNPELPEITDPIVSPDVIVETSLEVLVYPNPTTEIAHLKINEDYEVVSIELLDTKGRLILSKEYSKREPLTFMIDGERGTYLLRVKVDNNDWQLKRIQKMN